MGRPDHGVAEGRTGNLGEGAQNGVVAVFERDFRSVRADAGRSSTNSLSARPACLVLAERFHHFNRLPRTCPRPNGRLAGNRPLGEVRNARKPI